MATSAAQRDTDRETLLDAAEKLFYAKGFQLVGMDEIRMSAGLSLKRIYALYPGKEDLQVAVLQRRDRRWRGRLAAYVDQASDPRKRLLAMFDWFQQWFHEPDFRGCAWINAFGELGASSPRVLDQVRAHKHAFRSYIRDLAAGVGRPDLVDPLFFLSEGAMTSAAIFEDPSAAARAKATAAALLDCSR